MGGLPEGIAACSGFDWADGNIEKNWERHQVSTGECEQVFFQTPMVIAPDPMHSQDEPRYAALGQTASGRRLTMVFTMRGTSIRVILARAMSRRERRIYERA